MKKTKYKPRPTTSGNPGRPINKKFDYKKYINSTHWKSIRERYRKSALPQYCMSCLSPRYQLHHLTYERLGNEHPGDLVPLCGECHQRIHWVIRSGKIPQNEILKIFSAAFPLMSAFRMIAVIMRFRQGQTGENPRKAWESLRS